MGWASGSPIFSEVIEIIHSSVFYKADRKKIYRKLIEVFEQADCDTLDECVGDDPAFDEVWDELYPEER